MPGNPLETTYFAGFMVFFIDVVTETGLKVFYSCLGRNDQINAYLSSRKVSIELAKVFPKTLHQRVCSGNAKPDLFDISTLISILTCDTLKLLPPPINGWTVNNPPGTDVSTSADLLRLRKIRNKLVAHRSKAKFTKEEFESYFQTVEDILKRITQDYDPGSAPDLEKTCSKYKNMEVLLPLDKNKYFVKLQEWHGDFIEQVQKVLDGIKGLKIFFEKHDDKHKRYIKLLSEGGRLVLYKYLQKALERRGETIEEMLDRNRNTLTTKLVHQEMITSLYPPNDAGETSLNTDVHSWGLLLLARVILTFFSSSIKRNERKNIESLMKATENLVVTTKQALDRDRFAHSCENLVHNILTLSECLDEETESKVETILNTYRSQTEDVGNIDENLRTLGCQGFTSFIDMYTAAVREYRDALAQLGDDDEYFKNTHVLKLKVVLLCEDVEKKQLAERELKALLQTAITYSKEQLESEKSENEPVLEMIKHLKNMPTVQLLEVKKHCIILSIQCQAKQGILQLIGYIDGPEFQSHLDGISNYIEEMFQEIFILKGHFTLNSVHKAHPDRWQPHQDESNDVQLTCTSSEETGHFEGSETPTFQRKYTDRIPKVKSLLDIPVAEMSDKIYRLVTVVVNICPDPLRELFLKHASKDPKLKTPYTTLDAYLANRRTYIIRLRLKKILRQDQWKLIFPPPGMGQVNIAEWDLTLLSLMLKEMFELQPSIDKNIDTIRNIRNNLQHISGTGQVTDLEFDNMYQQLLSTSEQLAFTAKGQGYADKIKQDIENVANSVITDLGDVLRQWYTAEIVQIKHEMNELKEKMDTVQEDTSETGKSIKNIAVKRSRSAGKIAKRLKTVDHILEDMRGRFRALMNDSSSDDFTDPPEASKISGELETNHLVVISGYGSSPFEQTAFSVIGSCKYDVDRCVVITSPSDWLHISAEEVDLVMFLHPFGKKTFDEDKSKRMHGILDEIQRSTSSVDEEDVIDVMIVTDQTILDECKKHFTHDVIENPIVVYKPATDLVLEKQTYPTITERGKGQTTASYTSVVETETPRITYAEIEESKHIDIRERAFCQHPDGSFLLLVSSCASESDSVYKENYYLMHYNSKLEFISSYDIGRLPSLYRSDYYDMCCTDTGDVVISCFEVQEVMLNRISNGTCQFINSADIPGYKYIHRVFTCMNKIYAVCADSSVYVMDSELVVKKTIELYKRVDKWGEVIMPVVACVKKQFFYFEEHDDSPCTLICDTPEQKQLKYMNIEYFKPLSICAAGDDDSVFVLGNQGNEDSRILQVNTEMQILSDIVLKGKKYGVFKMVFDRTNGRLIFVPPAGNSLEQIYLK